MKESINKLEELKDMQQMFYRPFMKYTEVKYFLNEKYRQAISDVLEELKRLYEIELEHQRINGELRIELSNSINKEKLKSLPVFNIGGFQYVDVEDIKNIIGCDLNVN